MWKLETEKIIERKGEAQRSDPCSSKVPQVTSLNLFDLKIMNKLPADDFNQSANSFGEQELTVVKFGCLTILDWRQKFKYLIIKKFLLK